MKKWIYFVVLVFVAITTYACPAKNQFQLAFAGNKITDTSECDGKYSFSSRDFVDVKQEIYKQPTEESKLALVKQIIKDNCVSSDEIRAIMLFFSSEDNRFTIAKEAFPKCVDKNNYVRKLKDMFQSEKYKRELNKMLNIKEG